MRAKIVEAKPKEEESVEVIAHVTAAETKKHRDEFMQIIADTKLNQIREVDITSGKKGKRNVEEKQNGKKIVAKGNNFLSILFLLHVSPPIKNMINDYHRLQLLVNKFYQFVSHPISQTDKEHDKRLTLDKLQLLANNFFHFLSHPFQFFKERDERLTLDFIVPSFIKNC